MHVALYIHLIQLICATKPEDSLSTETPLINLNKSTSISR